MSYKPTLTQMSTLAAMAAGRVAYDGSHGAYINGRSGKTIGHPTIRRLRVEELIEYDSYGDPPRLTVLGESVLAAYMPGAVARAFMGGEQA